MYKLIIPLFALALLLVSCGRFFQQTPPVTDTGLPAPYGGELLTGKHTVILHTTKGDITLELDADAAPRTVTNFVELANRGYYNNLTFHRVIPDFMIQGGDPKGDGTGGASVFGLHFEDEINAKSYNLDKQILKDLTDEELPPDIADLTLQQFYERQGFRYNDALQSIPLQRGVIAMANSGPRTNGSQFFILQAERAPWLEGKHTVFGRVTEGMEVVDAIAAVERDGNDKPLTPVKYTVEVMN